MSTVLVVGSGGREHALAWKLGQSARVSRLIVAPGNPGMPRAWERWPADLGSREGFETLARKALAEKVDLSVIGPDNPLADGIADVFEKQGLLVFGPTAAAAKLEASKAFAKEVMLGADVPTARFFIASSKEEAHKILKSVPWPARRRERDPGPAHELGLGWVIKADGLALGKGVRVCGEPEEAFRAADELIGISGSLVIEERLSGEEISWMAFCDGTRCALLEPARDHKRLRDGDEGPNTGGMGAFSPVPGVPREWAERVRDEVFLPTLREMKKRGTPFRGLLYAGLMADIARGKLWVLEFNARFGDPETQALLPRMEGDALPWFEACARGDLGALPGTVPFAREAAVVVVGAARGYPERPEKGRPIRGLAPGERAPERPDYFCAGVAEKDGSLVTSGGRVFGAVGLGADLAAARRQAYQRLGAVSFEGMQYRSDVGGPG